MEAPYPTRRPVPRLSRRAVLKAGLAAGATLSVWPLHRPTTLWGAEAGQPRRGGILRVRGWDPPHFDPHLTIAPATHFTLSLVYGRLVRHQVGPQVQPGTFIVEPDLAERWEQPDDTTYVFHLRQGVKWHKKPPVNGRELVAEDVKFTYDRFLTDPGNANRYILEPVAQIEVVDRYTVKFLLKEPYVWFVNALAYPWSMWIIAPEVVEKYGDLKKAETAIGTGPFVLERYEPNVKAVFIRHPEYFRKDQPYVDGVEWLSIPDESTGLAMYRTGQIDCGPAAAQGKFEGLVRGPFGIAWEPDFPLYRTYAADSSWNAGHVNDPTITAMLKEQRRTKDLQARRKIIHNIQRYAAEQQYYVHLLVPMVTASWAPYVKNYGPNITFDYGSRVAALWLER
jgi:ABC-type transport system substrate-binding protein